MTVATRPWLRVHRSLFLLVAAALPACGSPTAEPVGTSRSAAGTDFPNDQPAYDYFVGKGLTNFQAAGIVGNLDQESGVDPSAVQSGGPGRGIAQWSVGGRWDTDSGDNLVAFAAGEGEPTTSLDVQLDFIWYELTTFSDYGLAALRASTDVTAATVAFETDFEGCSQCDESTRIAYAEDVLKAYGNDPVPGDAGADAGGAVTHDASAGDAEADAAPPATEPDAEVPTGQDAGAGLASDAGTVGDGGGESAPETSASSSGCAVGRAGTSGARGGWIAATALAILGVGRRRRRARPPRRVSGLARALPVVVSDPLRSSGPRPQ